MHDMTVRSSAWRAFGSGGSRGTVDSVRSYHLMQEMAGQFFKGELRNNVEHFEPFGFTACIVGKNSDGVAEAVMNFMSGSKNHSCAATIGDRRYRLRGLLQGESAQHDDIGQATLLRRTGTYVVSMDGQGNASQDTPGANNNNRMASLRHIKKQKQPTPPAVPYQNQTSQQQQQQQQAQQTAENFKHEGEPQDINTEVRCTATRIEFRHQDNVVGYYDVPSKKWYFVGDTVQQQTTDQQTTHTLENGKGVIAQAPNIYNVAQQVLSDQAGQLYKTPATPGQSISFGDIGPFSG